MWNFIFTIFETSKKTKLQTKTEFDFTEIENYITEDNLRKISTDSSPGISNIPSKILLRAKSKLIPILKILFNEFIKTSYIPFEWKFAEVTPQFKNKGDKSDLYNYRGISPIAKLFEKITNIIFFRKQQNFI